MNDLNDKESLLKELQRRSRDLELENARKFFRLRQRQTQRRFLALILAVLSIAFAAYLVFYRHPDFLQIPTMLALGTAFSVFALYYLRPSSLTRNYSADTNNLLRTKHYINERIDEVTEELKNSAVKTLEFNEQEKDKILSSIQTKLESEALENYLSGLRELVISNVREESLDDQFQQTRLRLGQEVQDLAKRGNLNLILGILTTIAGLSILGYAVFNPPTTMAAPELLSYFIPRVSLVVLIEVFAYFFLRLYKQSLGEIKYFQNEITNIEAKNLALQVTLRANDPALRSKIVESLAGTERNFILTKDQTTVELERERLACNAYSSITDSIKDIIKKKNR